MIVNQQSDLEAQPSPNDWKTILGLRHSDGVHWARVRAAQVNMIADRAIIRLIFSVISGGLVAAALHNSVAPWIGWVWFAGIVGLSVVLALPRLRDGRINLLSASQSDLNSAATGILIAGAGWGALPIMLGLFGKPEQALIAWNDLSLFITATVYSRPDRDCWDQPCSDDVSVCAALPCSHRAALYRWVDLCLPSKRADFCAP
jgi:hypothetical protein